VTTACGSQQSGRASDPPRSHSDALVHAHSLTCRSPPPAARRAPVCASPAFWVLIRADLITSKHVLLVLWQTAATLDEPLESESCYSFFDTQGVSIDRVVEPCDETLGDRLDEEDNKNTSRHPGRFGVGRRFCATRTPGLTGSWPLRSAGMSDPLPSSNGLS
jgi:hypothetical protein